MPLFSGNTRDDAILRDRLGGILYEIKLFLRTNYIFQRQYEVIWMKRGAETERNKHIVATVCSLCFLYKIYNMASILWGAYFYFIDKNMMTETQVPFVCAWIFFQFLVPRMIV